MAADAHLIPVVLGTTAKSSTSAGNTGYSPGAETRVAERDDGCADRLPTPTHVYTEAHQHPMVGHDHGPTNLANGILLCSSHHHRVHHDKWDIQVRDNIPYLTPPAHIDPHRRPRPGGRIRTPHRRMTPTAHATNTSPGRKGND